MLCDGIFAIAITLLVLDIGTSVEASHDINAVLESLVAPTISYMITFLILATYWRFHCYCSLSCQKTRRTSSVFPGL